MNKNKQGGLTDIFLFIIISFVVVVILGLFLFAANTMYSEVREQFTKIDSSVEGKNLTKEVDNTLGKLASSFQAFKWIAVAIIVVMGLSILISSYLVTVNGIYFVPYLLLLVVSIIVSVPLSNTYEVLRTNPDLAPTLSGFFGANFIWANFPIWVTVIGFLGAIIMFVNFIRVKSQQGGI